MSKQVLVNRLLNEEFTVGEPWKLPKGTGFVLPILGSPPFPDRDYVLLQEVMDKVTITDSGSISKVSVTNLTGGPVYIRKGTVLKGQSTQSRSPISGYVAEPSKVPIPIPVNCIHSSHGIRGGAAFNPKGLTPHSIFMALGDQGRTWRNASAWSDRTRAGGSGSAIQYARGPTASTLSANLSSLRPDNIVAAMGHIEEIKGTVEDVLKDIPGDHVNQVGIAVFDLRGVVAIETFDHPDSWKAFSDSITRSYAEILTEESDLYEVKTEKAASVLISFLRHVAACAKNLVTSNSVSNIFSLIGEKLSGEIVEIQGKEIHMTLARDERPLMKAGAPVGERRTFRTRGREEVQRQSIAGFQTAGQPYGPEDIRNISNWLRKKGSEDILKHIESYGPLRFTELNKAKLNISKGTLSSRLREAQNLGLIGHLSRRNGTPAYGLTPEGMAYRRQRKQQQAMAR